MSMVTWRRGAACAGSMRNRRNTSGTNDPCAAPSTTTTAEDRVTVRIVTTSTSLLEKHTRRKITGTTTAQIHSPTQSCRFQSVSRPKAISRTTKTMLCPLTLPPRPTIVVKKETMSVWELKRLEKPSRMVEDTLWKSNKIARHDTRGQKRCEDSKSSVAPTCSSQRSLLTLATKSDISIAELAEPALGETLSDVSSATSFDLSSTEIDAPTLALTPAGVSQKK
mmetsp:Transcript_34359/g.91944  ORF Transcript_34359/g.91944 Transcript_34359/m.91944 type:complete len:223 (+) Transcript_34359:79-747(+)